VTKRRGTNVQGLEQGRRAGRKKSREATEHFAKFLANGTPTWTKAKPGKYKRGTNG